MIDTEILLCWLHEMTKGTTKFQDDMYAAGAKKAYENVIELVNIGAFSKNVTK